MGMAAIQEWTSAMAQALPYDGKRYEVLDGELVVSPSPSWDHQRVAMALHTILRSYLSAHRIGEAFMAPADIAFSARRLVVPDLFVIPLVAGKPRPKRWESGLPLWLVTEVLSPSSARNDRLRKRVIYQDERVAEYWIVDHEARVVERWRDTDERPEIISAVLSWQPVAHIPPLAIDLVDMFREALD